VGSGGASRWQIPILVVFHALRSQSSRLGALVCPYAWQCTHQSRMTRFRATTRPRFVGALASPTGLTSRSSARRHAAIIASHLRRAPTSLYARVCALRSPHTDRRGQQQGYSLDHRGRRIAGRKSTMGWSVCGGGLPGRSRAFTIVAGLASQRLESAEPQN